MLIAHNSASIADALGFIKLKSAFSSDFSFGVKVFLKYDRVFFSRFTRF
jgi:hypothetical protein